MLISLTLFHGYRQITIAPIYLIESENFRCLRMLIYMYRCRVKHLDLLALFHYIMGGITAFFACIPFIHVLIGLAIVSGKFFEEADGSGPPSFFGWFFVSFGSVFILLGWCLAVFIFITGKKLKRRKNRIFCMVIAGVECMFMPFGTILGVLTLIALSKDSIKEIFED